MRNEEKYFSTVIRDFVDGKGTIFTDIKKLKKAISYNRTYLKRFISWYVGASNQQIVERYNRRLDNFNTAVVIEYGTTEVQRLDMDLTSLNTYKEVPVSDKDIDRIDFASI